MTLRSVIRIGLHGVLAAVLIGPLASSAQPDTQARRFAEQLAQPALLARLRQGGYVLYMRHGTTDNSRSDRVPVLDTEDCASQRVLNDEGRRLAVRLGAFIRQAQIPLSEVFHSPLCRARDTARLAFPEMVQGLHADPKLIYTANLTSEEKKPVVAETRRLLSAPVALGGNRMVVAHAPNLADLMGYFVRPEGTVVVIRPLGAGRFEYVASIPPALWPRLLAH